MLSPIKYGKVKTLALLALGLLAALPAHAQTTTTVRSTMVDILFDDADGSGDASCGDEINYVVNIDGEDLVNPTDVLWRLDVPANAEIVPNSIRASNPFEPAQVLSGDSPGDRVILVDFGELCGNPEICGPTGASMNYRLRILRPNALPALSVQGEVSGSNFPDAVTDDLATSEPDDPTVTPYTPCPGAPAEASLAATKTDSLPAAGDLDADGLADPGDTLLYQVVVLSQGDATAEGVRFETAAPDNTRLVAGSVTTNTGVIVRGNSAGDTLVAVALGDLPPGSGASLAFRVVVDNPVPAAVDQIACQGTVAAINLASVLTDDPDLPGAADPTLTQLDFDPDLELVKDDGGVSASPGEIVLYQLAFTNASRSPASGVVLTETVPEHSDFDPSGSSPGWDCSPDGSAGSTCTLALGSLGPGASGSATFAVRVAPSLPAGVDRLVNTGLITDDGTQGAETDPADNSATDTTPLEASPELALTKTLAPGSDPRPGGVLVWSLAYENAGNQDSSPLTLTETVPPATTFEPSQADPEWSCSVGGAGSVCSLAVGPLPAGVSGSATFAVRVADPLPAGVEEIENCARLSGPEAGATQGCQTTQVEDAAPDLAVEKSDHGAAIAPGETLLYTLTAQNVGSQGATGVVLEETVPANTRFEPAASDPEWLCTGSGTPGDLCTLEIGALSGRGGSALAAFAVTVDSTLPAGVEEIENTVEIGDDGLNGPDADPSNNTDTELTPLVGAMPEIEVDKTLDTGLSDPRPGGLLVWNVTVANRGNQDASALSVSDRIPSHTTFVAGDSHPGWSCPAPTAGSVCTFELSLLPAGGEVAIPLAVLIDNPLPPGVEVIENCASAGEMAEGCQLVSVPGALPDLGVRKDDGGATVAPGAAVSYLITYDNHGNQGATGVVVEDLLPEATAFVPSQSDPRWSCEPPGPGGTLCRLEVGALPAGESGSAVLTVSVPLDLPPEVDLLTNRVEIADDGTNGVDPDLTDNQATDTTPVVAPPPPPPPEDETPVLEVTLADVLSAQAAGAGGASAGDTVTYVVRVTNPSAVTAHGVVFTVAPDPHTELLPNSVEPSQGSVLSGAAPGHSHVTVALGELAAGAAADVTFEVQVDRELPPAVEFLSVHGQVQAPEAADEPSDDPDTPEDDDPTRTPLVAPETEGPVEVPTLSELGLSLLIVLLAAGGVAFLRSRPRIVPGSTGGGFS